MKQNLLLTLTLMLCCIFSSNAQVSSMRLGYCNGEVASKGQIGISGENTIEAAIFLTQSQLSIHNGNQIESIKAGLATKLNLTSLTVWVRSELNGENLAEGTAESIKKGWNDIFLTSPYTITGEKGLYIGYTFTQKGSAYGISTVGSYVENGLFIKLGNDSEWESPTEYGIASIEAMIIGENLPKYDLSLISTYTKENYPIETPMPINIEVRNVASHTITGFDVECRIEGIDPIISHVDCDLAYDAVGSFDIEITPALTELKNDVEMTISLINLKEGDDQLTDNNSLKLNFNVINKEFKRNVLIEEFTTELCPNCPYGTNTLHSTLELLEEEYPGRANTICHHSGYYTDWLTIGASEDLLWLFNSGGSTYAPAFMSDRTGVWSNPGTAEKMADIFRKRLDKPAYVGIEIDATYDNEERILTVTATGERSMEFCENPARISIYLVENDIKARNQAGASAGDPYIHNHVMRACNATWGKTIDWTEDNTFEYTHEFTIKSAWNTNNMEIIAFVSDYDSTDATSCVVENSEMRKFTDFYYDNIESISDNKINVITNDKTIEITGNYKSFTVYNINGQSVIPTQLHSGIYIVKVVTENSIESHKVMVK